ncbi:hypothetical protein JCM3765_000130 [Sporobolomyces pararoseus]
MLSRQRPVDYSQPPSPHYILRGHLHPLTQLYFSPTKRSLLLSGDSSGSVAIWNLRTYRPVLVWKPHQEGILSLSQLGSNSLISHGRDNKLHLYNFAELLEVSERGGSSFEKPLGFDSFAPTLTLDVNALNFCRLSMLDLSTWKGKEKEGEGLIAVPSLTKDDQVDILHVPSKTRLHRSVGISSLLIGGGNEDQKTGSVMAVHLLYLPTSAIDLDSFPTRNDSPTSSPSASFPASPVRKKTLHVLIGYESGQLALLEFAPTSNFSPAPSSTSSAAASRATASDNSAHLNGEPPEIELAFPIQGKMIEENEGWNLVWVEKCHRDAIMSIEVSKDSKFVYTVGVDHFIVKYRLWDLNQEEAQLPRAHIEPTNSPGKSTIRSRLKAKDSKAEILAVGGWNGETTIYSSKTLQPLACLSHHRNSVQTLDFAPVYYSSSLSPASTTAAEIESSDSDDEEGDGASEDGRGTLATGGMDTKICLWKIYPP